MKRGYTLTEILVAVAIIGVLTAIALPIGKSVTRGANQAACLQKLRSLGAAVEGYTNDHNGTYPDLVIGRENRRSSEGEPVLEEVLLEYAGGDPEAFQCPADKEHFRKSGSSYFWNHQLSGQLKTQVTLLGMKVGMENIPLITDKESFHGDHQGTNFLYADQTASRKVKFEVGSR